jgi:hypothetical protein
MFPVAEYSQRGEGDMAPLSVCLSQPSDFVPRYWSDLRLANCKLPKAQKMFPSKKAVARIMRKPVVKSGFLQ